MPRKRSGGGCNSIPTAVVLIALGAAAPAAGQAATEPRIWTNVQMQGRFEAGSAWRWTSDSIVRTREGAATLDFLAERVVVTRELTQRSSVGAGYAYGAGFPDGGSLREHRFVQQYGWSGGARPRVSLKSRVEERFVTGQAAMLLRARQQVKVTWPLAMRRGVQGVTSNELLVQTRTATPASWGFDSNRMFVGIARALTPRQAVEIGYLNVYSHGASGNRTSHVMSVTLLVAL